MLALHGPLRKELIQTQSVSPAHRHTQIGAQPTQRDVHHRGEEPYTVASVSGQNRPVRHFDTC